MEFYIKKKHDGMEDNFGTEENQNFWFSAVMFATELLATATRPPKNPKKKRPPKWLASPSHLWNSST
jgi:hypothetical protein